MATMRYALGTARLRTRAATQDLVGRLRRRPATARVVPRPPRPRVGRTLRLTHALVASDLNAQYLGFWPLVQRAWREVTGLEAVLVLIADAVDVPEELREDPAVHPFAPIPGVHTAFQAQCIRLLYPALLDAAGVITSDVDMVPLSRRYFHRPAAYVDERHFLAYRDVLLDVGEVPICYNAALPQTWAAVFGVATPDDVRTRLAQWAAAAVYSGEHGGTGWGTDQQILFRTLVEHGRRTPTVWILDDHYTRFRRLERAALRKAGALERRDRELIARGSYSDFHCVAPLEEFRDLNELAVDLAIDAAQRRASRNA